MQIRFERTVDAPRIHEINQAAFESATEADIVDALRRTTVELISLVAEEDGEIVGHILFSPVTMTGTEGLRAMALAPMAAIPDRQRRGIGSALVRAGLEECRRRGVEVVFVLVILITTRVSASLVRLGSESRRSSRCRTTPSWLWNWPTEH